MSGSHAGEPLPRRVRRSHLEPQLATPWSAGSGTPFAAFEDADRDGRDDAEAGAAEGVAAQFHDGTERGRAATEAS